MDGSEQIPNATEAPAEGVTGAAEAQASTEGADAATEPDATLTAPENALAPDAGPETATTAESADAEGQAPDATGDGEQTPGASADQQPTDDATPASETPGNDPGYLGARATDPEHRADAEPQTTAHHLEAMARGFVGELARDMVDIVHEGRHILVPRPRDDEAEGE
jgi:hypothetical protein